MHLLKGLALGLVLAMPAAAQDIADRGPAALAWVNGFRAKQGLAPLSLSEPLARAAASHAADLARTGAFSHTGSDGSSIGARARRAGYRFCFIAENIAKGSPGVEAVLKGWAGSPGHRRNLLAKDAREVALVEGSGRLWIMVLGSDGC